MSDKLAFLSGDKPVEAQEIVAEPVAEIAQPEATPEAAPEPAPEPAPAAQPPLSEKETVGFYKAMQEERDKRQTAERQLAELRAQAEPADPLPLEAVMEQRLYAMNLQTSRRFAETQYGADQVSKVHDWAAAKCDADPIFNQQMRASDHPYENAMQAFNREQILAEVGTADLAQFQAWKAAQAGLPVPTPTPAATLTPPKSLVNASGNGAVGRSVVTEEGGAAFGALFTPK